MRNVYRGEEVSDVAGKRTIVKKVVYLPVFPSSFTYVQSTDTTAAHVLLIAIRDTVHALYPSLGASLSSTACYYPYRTQQAIKPQGNPTQCFEAFSNDSRSQRVPYEF
jgi:hypothetical protein